METERIPLFAGLSEEEISPYLTKVRSFAAGSYLLRYGERAEGFGVVLSGSVRVFKEDYFGNRNFLSLCGEGDIFLEAVTLTRPENSPVTVQAATDCRVAFLDYTRIFAPSSNCRAHARILENLLRVLSTKVLALNRKITVLAGRTIRDKVLAYLKETGAGREEFEIPFNREELAGYLCVDRSALSRELAAMKRRGEIEYRGNRFRVTATE